MVLAADYPFLDVFWTMIIFFSWVVWIRIIIQIQTTQLKNRIIVQNTSRNG